MISMMMMTTMTIISGGSEGEGDIKIVYNTSLKTVNMKHQQRDELRNSNLTK